MSRIGKKVRPIPSGVTVEINKVNLKVKGPKGELTLKLHPRIIVTQNEGNLEFSVKNENDKNERAIWGTFSSLVNNMLDGVTKGFKKELEINGVGFRAGMKGQNLNLEIGFSHPVEVKPMPGTVLKVEKNVITVEGIDKQAVGEMAAIIRGLKKPEPYKGKGIRYIDEVVRRKAGKTADREI